MSECIYLIDEVFTLLIMKLLILCRYNSTEIKSTPLLNFLGFEEPTPTVGDRIICLQK